MELFLFATSLLLLPATSQPQPVPCGQNENALGVIFENDPPSWSAQCVQDCWLGITCSASGTDIAEIDVSNLQLSGIVWWSNLLFFLPSLEKLVLSSNQFSGTLDVTNLPSSLLHLDLSKNQFSGTVDFSNLPPFLEELDLSYNLFSGPVVTDHVPASLQHANLIENYFETPCCSSPGAVFTCWSLPCKNLDEECTVDGMCCSSNVCRENGCSIPECLSDGTSCSSDADCCSGSCDFTSQCDIGSSGSAAGSNDETADKNSNSLSASSAGATNLSLIVVIIAAICGAFVFAACAGYLVYRRNAKSGDVAEKTSVEMTAGDHQVEAEETSVQ